MTSRDIGLRMTRLRDLRKLTTAALAHKVGMSQAQISRLENGRQGFRSATLIRVAGALGAPPFYLYMKDDEWETYQMGLVARGKERQNGFITLDEEKGYVEVAPDPRLDISQTCTLEAWIRPFLPGGAIMDKSVGGAVWGFRMDIDGGLRIKGMHGWFHTGFQYPQDKWTHVVGVYELSGVRRLYINGKLKAERKPYVLIVK